MLLSGFKLEQRGCERCSQRSRGKPETGWNDPSEGSQIISSAAPPPGWGGWELCGKGSLESGVQMHLPHISVTEKNGSEIRTPHRVHGPACLQVSRAARGKGQGGKADCSRQVHRAQSSLKASGYKSRETRKCDISLPVCLLLGDLVC